MASLNKKQTIYTYEGAVAKHIPPKQQLERSVMSCMLWEGEFYEDGVTIAKRIAGLIAQIPAKDVAEIATKAKTEMHLRHTPLFMARELARTIDGRKQLAEAFAALITRPDDITEFLSIYWKDNSEEPLAKQIKKHLGASFARFDEYQLQKYNGGKKAVKLRDAIRILRPKPANQEQSELWRKLVKDELATPDTWEVEISASKDKKLSWERLLKESKLGGLAMLRNIRNMKQAGVDSDLIKHGIATLKSAKLLPMNFISAATHNPEYESDIEVKFLECFAGKPKMSGKTAILVDVSGSMRGALSGRSELQRKDVACALAMIARETFEDCNIYSFSDKLAIIPARHGFALKDAIINSQPHSGTQLGEAVRHVVSALTPDRIIVITDEQSSDPVPDVKGGYMINVASNKNGVGYGAWFHIDGWSDKVINYVYEHEKQ
jgi:hypothetical protein